MAIGAKPVTLRELHSFALIKCRKQVDRIGALLMGKKPGIVVYFQLSRWNSKRFFHWFRFRYNYSDRFRCLRFNHRRCDNFLLLLYCLFRLAFYW